MRIGYSCHDSLPSSDTNTQQIFWTLFEVARLGASVDLFVPSIAADARPLAREKLAEYYGAPGPALPASLTLVPIGTGAARGALAKGWFDWHLPRRLARGHYDLVWTRDALTAARAVRRRLPTVFETYRPDFAAAPAFRLWRRLVLGSRYLRGVITHSAVAAAAFAEAGLPASQSLVAHNGFSPELMGPPVDARTARMRLGLPLDAFLVVYTGHVGREKGIDALVQLAAATPDVLLLIVGADARSPEAEHIERIAREAGAANVLVRPRVPLKEVAGYLYAADCLIVPPTDEPLRAGRTVLPMKIFSYLAAGRPILAPQLPDVTEVLIDGRTACLVAPGDVAAAGALLSALKADPARCAELGANARRAAAEFTWEARGRRLLEFLERAAADARQAAAEPRGFRPAGLR